MPPSPSPPPTPSTRSFTPEQVSFLKALAPRYAIAMEENRTETYIKEVYGIYFARFPIDWGTPLFEFQQTMLRGKVLGAVTFYAVHASETDKDAARANPSPTRPRPSPPMKTRARFLKRKAEEDAAQVEANQLHLAMTSTRNVRQKLNAEEDAAQLDVDKLKLATVRARLSTTRRANTKKAADKRSDNAVADVTTSNLATDDLPCAASSASISTFTPDAFESTAATTTTTLTADVDVDIFTDVSIAARDQPVAMTAADEPTIMTTTGEVIPPETRDLLLDLAVEHALSVESAIPNLDSLSDLRDDREVEAELAIGHAASCCVSRAVGLIGHAASCCVSRAVGRTLNEEHEREWLDRVDWIGGAATRHMRVTRISDDVDEDSDDADMPPLEDISDNDIKIDFSDSESGSSWSSEHSK